MYLKNIIVRKPKNAKLCPVGKEVYVYHVVETVYHADKRYNTDKRVSIGKLVKGSENQMIPNDRFGAYYPELLSEFHDLSEPPQFSQTIHVGAIAVEQQIAIDEGLTDILINIYGNHIASEIINVVTFMLTAESAVFQHYPTFMRSHLQLGKNIRSDSYISSQLLHREITDDRIIEMLRQWNKRHQDIGKVYIGCDSTNFNTEADDIGLAQFGKAKDDPTSPQVNLAVTVSQKDSTPLCYDLWFYVKKKYKLNREKFHLFC